MDVETLAQLLHETAEHYDASTSGRRSTIGGIGTPLTSTRASTEVHPKKRRARPTGIWKRFAMSSPPEMQSVAAPADPNHYSSDRNKMETILIATGSSPTSADTIQSAPGLVADHGSGVIMGAGSQEILPVRSRAKLTSSSWVYAGAEPL